MSEKSENRQADINAVKKHLLERIDSPDDLRNLREEDLPCLCTEIREFLIDHLSSNPGHFASSMGAVEIIVALHYVFNTPRDRIVFDVGHQAYAHKILTGRRRQFGNQRTLDGISGFPSPLESSYDTFVAGHAGNSISAALGMAIADKNTPGNEDRKTVALIGDASISGGLAFEGLNNASNNPNNLLIILNDNDMSIDNNVGALHRYLSDITTSAGYNRWRNRIYDFGRSRGLISDDNKGIVTRFNNSIKSLISQHQNIFDGLNIRYFGPFDGHDIDKIVKILREIKDMNGPRILHLCTVKGKGYAVAEEDPSTWHAPGKFDPATGQRLKKKLDGQPILWQEIFGNTLVELAETNRDIVGITAAMQSGTSMNLLNNRFPERTFDVGISEGHAVTFAGGLAAAGKKPFVAIYSSFLQRAYDNIIHDVAIQGLPVTFCIDRAGIVGEDGVTHHGLLDLAYLRCIPGMTVAAPMDEKTLRDCMAASVEHNGPMAIRYPRGKSLNSEWKTPFEHIDIGRGRMIAQYDDARIAILSVGPVGADALKAAEEAAEAGVYADVYDMIWVKPLDKEILDSVMKKYDVVLTVEDGTTTGGFGSAVAEYFAAFEKHPRIEMAGVDDIFVAHGSVGQLHQLCGFDHKTLRNKIISISERSDRL